MNGMDAQTRKHTQARYGGMAKEHEPAAANATRKGGPRIEKGERSTQRHPPPSLYRPSTRVKEWEHNKQVCPRKRNATATAADKHTTVWHEG